MNYINCSDAIMENKRLPSYFSNILALFLAKQHVVSDITTVRSFVQISTETWFQKKQSDENNP